MALADQIVDCHALIGDPGSLVASSGSALARDDAVTAPYQLTSAWRTLMAAGVDNLDALRTALIDHQELRPMAPFSLCRTALECFAAAYWMTSPSDSTVRVQRTLRWSVQDLTDAQSTARLGTNPTPLDTRLARLRQVITAAGTDAMTAQRRLQSTEIVKDADTAAGRGDHEFERVWRVCSGFAHGRRWPGVNILDREKVREDALGGDGYRLTASFEALLWPASEAVHLMGLSVSRYTILSSAPA